MLTYLVAFLCAGLVAAFATPWVARFAHRVDAIDLPGEARKIHQRAIPRIGGIAVVLGFFAPIVGLAIYSNRISWLLYGSDARMISSLIAGSLGIVALGVYDDIKGADAKLKFAVQITVAVGMWFGGFRVDLLTLPFVGTVELGVLSLPLTVLWMVGVVNALNLIDGLDGLATGTALFAVLVLFGVSFADHAALLCVLLASLGGALLGFLFFNFNPAKIFLGDSGSMFIGLILASASVWTQRKGATAAALLIPVLALGLPILDTGLAVIRRVGRGQNPFRADREHLHHRLLDLGLTHRGAVLTLYTLSGVFALAALAMLENDATQRAIALGTVSVVVLVVLRRVGVFSRSSVAPAPLETRLASRDLLRAKLRALRLASDRETAWQTLAEVLPQLGLREARLAWLSVHHEDEERELVHRWRSSEDSTPKAEWRLDAPPSAYDKVHRLALAEGEARFGSLTVLRGTPSQDGRLRTEQDFLLELVSEALVDFAALQRAARDGLEGAKVVNIPRRVFGPEAGSGI